LASISDLRSDHKNARKRTDRSAALIKESITRYGAARSIVIDEENRILAGNGTIEGAKAAGIKNVRIIETDGDEIIAVKRTGLTEDQKIGLALADNRTSDLSEWDKEMLHQLSEKHDITPWFEAEDLAEIMGEVEVIPPEGLTDADDVPEAPEEPVSKLGDLWILGDHRLLCGDSTVITDVERLMAGAKVDLVYTDPPYGISIVGDKGSVGGEKLAKVGIYEPVAGDGTIEVALEAIQVIKTLKAKVEIIWGGNYYANALDNSSCWVVWDKDNTGNFADAELAWTNQKTAVRIFKHTWNGMIKASEHGQKRVHPTQKPVKLAEWCIQQYGENCKTVLDLFCGSGSTLLACETSRKSGYMMELSPAYCDVIVKRWEDFTGKKAILEESQEAY
jgi:16S rRNA G966 N2-methylase RsmD